MQVFPTTPTAQSAPREMSATWLSVLERTEYFSIVARIILVTEMMEQVLGLPLHASLVMAKINKDKNCPSLIGTLRLRASRETGILCE